MEVRNIETVAIIKKKASTISFRNALSLKREATNVTPPQLYEEIHEVPAPQTKAFTSSEGDVLKKAPTAAVVYEEVKAASSN